MALSIAEVTRNTHFLLHFYFFSQWAKWALFQINNNVLISWQNIFLPLISLLHFVKILVWFFFFFFLKHPLFSTFSLFLTFRQVCNISNKYCFSNNSDVLTQETLHPSFIRCLPGKFKETSTFYDAFTSFHSGWGV